MSKFETYNIALKDLQTGAHLFEYILDDMYFEKIDSPEVRKGDLKATIKVEVKFDSFRINFDVNGTINIPCSRCLDDLELPISSKDVLQVKLGADYGDEGDFMIIPESDGSLNVAWFLYEMIVLTIPLKHIHAPGMCNQTMANKLKKHLAHHVNDEDSDDNDYQSYETDEEETPTDPRWDGLKSLLEDN